jgi:OOP family OmpA-OmpF porin
MPVELGVEWLFSGNLSATAFLENRIHSVEWDKLDGVAYGSNYYDKRDELPRAGLGLTWRFGGDGSPVPVPKAPEVVKQVVKEVAAPVVEKVVAPLDADKDGVIDNLDKCPNTPAGVAVDGNGCPVDADKDGVADYLDKCPNTPAGVAVDAKGCPVDSDKDGIADYLDKCPNTPTGIAIDAKGCPVDSDKDGIADYLDKCPNTMVGEKVDSTGCVEIKFEKGTKLTLNGILFPSGKSEIDPSSEPVLSHAASAIKTAPQAKIEIAGFTDNSGKAKSNQALSAKRAQAVKAYLVKLGVPAKQIAAKGYGAAQPVADNKTEEGRSKNRRIEFRVK